MGKKGRQTFTDVWANQTNLGKQFGLSPIAMGKKLKELKLRGEDGNPTAQALCQGYCTSTPLKDGTPFLAQAGRLDDPVSLLGVDVLQIQLGHRLVNTNQPRATFAT